MKRIIVIFLGIYSCLSLSAQTVNDVIQRMQEIQQESGDSIARDYLASNKAIFDSENANPTYLVMWGLLTSYMWNANPSESLKKEYKEYLDIVIDDEIKSETFVPDNPQALATLWNLTHDYYNMLYQDGEREGVLILLKCIHRWFTPYPEARNTVGYAQSLYDLCILLIRDMHKYEEGMPYAEEYLNVSKSVFGENSFQYAIAIYNMHIFPSKSISEKADIIKKAISLYEKAEGHEQTMLNEMKATYKTHMMLLTGVTNTEDINVQQQGYLSINDCIALVAAERGAEALESLLYYKEYLSQDQHLDTLRYANVITYIISTYLQINDLPAAQKELDDFNAKIGVDNIPGDYAQIFYSDASLVALRLKDYVKALRYAHLALKKSEQSSVSTIEYCKILGNISLMYAEAANVVNKEFYLDAKWYIDEAVSVFEEKVGPLDEQGNTGLTLLNNKAYVYASIGDKKGAIETYENIVSGFADNKDLRGAWVLAANNLAVLYTKSEHPEKAVELLERLSSENIEYKKLFNQNLALAYYATGDRKLKNTLMDYNNICYNNCMDVFNFFTEAEREDFWTGNARELLVTNNLVADKYPEIRDVAFDNLLFVKNLKLMSADILKRLVDNSSNEELKKKYNNILSLRDAISYRSTEQDSIRIWTKQLQNEERGILTLVPDYKKKLLGAFHSWNEIKKALKEDEIAVDFTYVAKLKDWDNADDFYCAFVITKDSQSPELVSLCEVDSVNKYLIGATPDAQQISLLYKESTPIYKKVWGNLERYIKGKKTIYFSPTGQLNLLNHNALVMGDGKLFGDCYNLVRLSSTDKILSLDTRSSSNQAYHSAVVYGGIQYDLSVAEMRDAAKEYSHKKNDQFLLAMRSEDERGRWNYLPGTKTEAQNIYSLLTSNKVSTTLLQEKEANEESFKALSGISPQIIHLSTHGFFLDTAEKVKKNPFMNTVGNYSEKEDKLIRTGVLMAGANNVWCGREQISGIEDGILTADEISRLDLKGTKLVVLSACETAKGQIDEIDGVLGLQRGLKKAGVGSILMSLWKVSDAVTSILMTHFYTNMANGMSLHESLKVAAQKVKEQYPDPYYWASFVLLD